MARHFEHLVVAEDAPKAGTIGLRHEANWRLLAEAPEQLMGRTVCEDGRAGNRNNSLI